jgi:hypothetical protein
VVKMLPSYLVETAGFIFLTIISEWFIIIKIDDNTNGIIIVVKFYYGKNSDSNSTEHQEIPCTSSDNSDICS